MAAAAPVMCAGFILFHIFLAQALSCFTLLDKPEAPKKDDKIKKRTGEAGSSDVEVDVDPADLARRRALLQRELYNLQQMEEQAVEATRPRRRREGQFNI